MVLGVKMKRNQNRIAVLVLAAIGGVLFWFAVVMAIGSVLGQF